MFSSSSLLIGCKILRILQFTVHPPTGRFTAFSVCFYAGRAYPFILAVCFLPFSKLLFLALPRARNVSVIQTLILFEIAISCTVSRTMFVDRLAPNNLRLSVL